MKTNDIILQTATKVIVFVIFVVAFFLLNAGNTAPGRGCIGPLMASSAVVLLFLAFDLETIKKVLPFNFQYVTALGLLIAFLTALGAAFFKYPLLTHTFAYVDLPILGETELTTALIFDIGVFLTVIGATMTVILTIGEDR